MEKVFRPSPSRNTALWGLGLSALVTFPMFFLLLSASSGPIFFLIPMTALFTLPSTLMVYVTLSGVKMRYELGESRLKVKFGFSGVKIPYAAIENISLSRLTLLLRLIGGSWPGLYWGLFQAKEINRVCVYSTKAIGPFVLISLVNGDKIALSPEQPEDFIEAINIHRGSFGQMKTGDLGMLGTPRKALYIQVITVSIAYLAFLGYILWIYPSLPEVIPVHFGLNWKPDRWGHKSEIFAVAGIAAIFPILNAFLTLKFGRYDRTLSTILSIIFTLVTVMFFAIVSGMVTLV